MFFFFNIYVIVFGIYCASCFCVFITFIKFVQVLATISSDIFFCLLSPKYLSEMPVTHISYYSTGPWTLCSFYFLFFLAICFIFPWLHVQWPYLQQFPTYCNFIQWNFYCRHWIFNFFIGIWTLNFMLFNAGFCCVYFKKVGFLLVGS